MRHLIFSLTALLLSALLLASCASEGNAVSPDEQTPVSDPAADEDEPEAGSAQAETAAPVRSPTVSKLADHCWFIATPTTVGSLIFDGNTASLSLLENGEDKSISGPVTFTEKTLTIDGQEMGWAVVASFCRLTWNGVSYSFNKAGDADEANGPYALLTNTWSGDGLTLSFNGTEASLTIEGERSYSGSFDFTAGKNLTIHDDSQGGALVNLAQGAVVTASSQETEDFPGPLAADGDFGTRWSSEYTDPSWLLLDLGSVKTVGAATVYFETACSQDFMFEVSSDGVIFTEAASVSNNSSAGIDAPVAVLFSEPMECRYVRFVGLSRATQWGHSIYELELYRGIPGEALCTLEYAGSRINLKLDGKTYSLSKSD